MCGLLAMLIVVGGLGLAPGSAHAEAAEAEPQGARESAGGVAAPDAADPERRRATGKPRSRRAEEWWSHAREMLFSDLKLSPEQARGIDAIVAAQLAARRRAEQLRDELAAAQQQGDAEQRTVLRAESRANREQIKRPHARIEELRGLLTEEQRPTFDKNRARLAAEGRQERQERKRPRGRRARKNAEQGVE